MSLKEFITTYYSKEIYLGTKKLQQEMIRNARSKTQMIFLYKCLSKKVTPKSFRLHAPINTTKMQKHNERIKN